MSEGQKPSVGRIVHVFDRNLNSFHPIHDGPYPAMVTFVHEDGQSINVSAFPQRVLGDVDRVPPKDPDTHGQSIWWQWPERV